MMAMHLFEAGHQPRLLVVASHPRLSAALARFAERDGFAVVTVETGEDALRAGNDFAGCIVDSPLRGGDAAHWLREFRAAGLRTPVLLLGSCVEASTALRGARADIVLLKPFTTGDFSSRVRELVAGGAFIAPLPTSRRTRRRFHLSMLVIPALLAFGAIVTWWLLNLP